MSTTLVCAFSVLAFAATARAQDDDAAVDWDEAANYHKIWRAYGGYAGFMDVDTSIRSQAKNTAIDYTDDYNGRWSSPDGPYYDNCTDETADDQGDFYRYIVYKSGDAVNNWNYSVGNCYPLAKHEFYACDYWRYLEVEFCTLYIE
jgi:hypothetical protein